MDPDPWNWSVTDVQQFFRERAADYVADMPHGRLPPLAPFLNALHGNDVSGAILLTTVDANSLREDFGLTSLGVRGTVIRCITKLRRHSVVYASENDLPYPQTPSSLQLRALPPTPTPQEAEIPSTEPVGEHVRPGEIQVQDAQGRKRRKLDISNSHPVQEAEPSPAVKLGASAVHGYIGDSACSIDELFYAQTDIGQEIGRLQANGDIIVWDTDREADLEDQNFQFGYQSKTVGEARYVYAQVRHFLNNAETIDLRRQDREALGILPYREHIHQHSRSATVLQFHGNREEPIAVKENAAHLESGYVPDEQTQQASGEWDFLEQKYNSKQDKVLPVYGESDDGDEEGMTQTTEVSGEQEAVEQADSRFIHPNRVAEIIEREVRQFIADWNETLPELEKKKAWTEWKKTKQSRTIRDTLVQGAQAKIEHLTRRLNKMKSKLLLDTWQSEQSIIRACGTLEATVEDREDHYWKINVWKRRQEPTHVVRHTTKASRPDLQAPVTGEGNEGAFPIPTNDRFSVSPAPVNARAQEDADMEDAIQYEADDEEFHTPTNSPLVSPQAIAVTSDLPEDMTLTPAKLQEDSPVKDESDVDLPQDPDVPVSGTERSSSGKNSKYSPESNASETEDLPSPSGYVRQRRAAPQSPHPLNSRTAPIDLTVLSSESSASKKKSKLSLKHVVKPLNFRANPMDATPSEVDSWSFDELVKNNDRQRILIKRLRDLGEKQCKLLDDCLKSLSVDGFKGQLQAACHAIRVGSTEGISLQKDHADTIMQASYIYLSWAFPTYSLSQIKNLDTAVFESALSSTQLDLFTSMLASCLRLRTQKLFVQPKLKSSKLSSSSGPILISSGDERLNQDNMPHRKRKRQVGRSKAAETSRQSAFQRQKKFDESQASNSILLAAMASSQESFSGVEINPVRDEQSGPLYICENIAKQMKAHQIDGARFLWREITADDGDDAQGCVLAHTMGLGKTMQTIALLIAVNEAAHSKTRAVSGQLPSHLRPKDIRGRQLRMLILCPPALIQNWRREIEYWAAKRLHIFSLDSTSRASHLQTLQEWQRFGGIVLLGYQMFRIMVSSKTQKGRSEDELEKLKNMLLKETEIVVADEAHHLKNKKSSLTEAAALFQSHSRIGLTGTPMSNDVQEIYALVSWVAPGYLGGEAEFRAHYAEPIQEGLWQDSSAYERRRSIKKLKVLHAEIQPKVNRANIEVLRGSLKPKIEFLISVPLTETQIELYRRYIKILLSGDRTEVASQVTIFAWLAVLTLLTNHPRCFQRKLIEPPKKSSKKSLHEVDGETDTSGSRTPTPYDSGSVTPLYDGVTQTTEQFTDSETIKNVPGDEPVRALGFTNEMIQEILEGSTDGTNPKLSSKVTVFLDLLNYSLECGDKVLVFSSSIPTLDYLDDLLSQQAKRFGRIDGQTPVKKRIQSLEEFHNHEFDIMLVSTRAGGVGLNIQGANRVFIFDFGFNPTWEEQAIGRAYRLGQTKPVYVYRFLAGGTFEINIHNKQLFKSSLAQRVVDKKNPRRNAERNTKAYLYEPQQVKQEDLTKWIGKDPHVLDRLLKQHGQIEQGKVDTMVRAIETMETLQEEALDEALNEEELNEVNLEIEQGKLRPRGKKALHTAQTVPLRMHSHPTAAPASTAPFPPPAAPNFGPPPSTYASPSAHNGRLSTEFLGGLPLPDAQQPYRD